MRELILKPPALPAREEESHKGTYGSVLLVAGSQGMTGAAILAGRGALRGGAGLVYLACPLITLPVIATAEPSYLTLPLPDDQSGRITGIAEDVIQDHLPQMTALGIGPGLGQSNQLDRLVTDLYQKAERPSLFDADALNALSRHKYLLDKHAGSRILTPHPGEFARLIDSTPDLVQADRENLATQFAADKDVVLVLKGHETIVTNGSQVYLNTTGNAGMATGGSGDVLTGLITALLAQGMPPFEAAQLGVYLHGQAGDLAAEQFGRVSLIASDLPKFLALAVKEYEG